MVVELHQPVPQCKSRALRNGRRSHTGVKLQPNLLARMRYKLMARRKVQRTAQDGIEAAQKVSQSQHHLRNGDAIADAAEQGGVAESKYRSI